MFRRGCHCINKFVPTVRKFSATHPTKEKVKITICGAAGNVGRLVSFCLKTSSLDIHLSLFDTSTDLKHVNDQLGLVYTPNTIEDHVGPLKLRQSLKDSNIVAILARSKPSAIRGASTIDTFELNFPIVANVARCCLEMCPEAVLAVGTNPLNSIIPALNEMYTLQGYQLSHKILGITAMDIVHASAVYADAYNLDPADVFIPVTGGTTFDTIAPIFSQAAITEIDDLEEMSQLESERLHNRFLDRKKLTRSAEFPNAYATAQFLESVVRALNGEKDIVETAFVSAPEEAPAKYMISLIDLDQHGIETVYGPPKTLNRFEKKLMYPSVLNLQRDINQAEQHVSYLVKNSVEMRRQIVSSPALSM